MTVDKEGTVKWTTKSETGKLTFAIEQFRWNKWVKVGEVDGVGTPTSNEYSFKIVAHSGKNQIRVRQTDYSGQPRLSKPVDFMSGISDITFAPAKVSKEISFVSLLSNSLTYSAQKLGVVVDAVVLSKEDSRFLQVNVTS